jgi:hypothetical protein
MSTAISRAFLGGLVAVSLIMPMASHAITLSALDANSLVMTETTQQSIAVLGTILPPGSTFDDLKWSGDFKESGFTWDLTGNPLGQMLKLHADGVYHPIGTLDQNFNVVDWMITGEWGSVPLSDDGSVSLIDAWKWKSFWRKVVKTVVNVVADIVITGAQTAVTGGTGGAGAVVAGVLSNVALTAVDSVLDTKIADLVVGTDSAMLTAPTITTLPTSIEGQSSYRGVNIDNVHIKPRANVSTLLASTSFTDGSASGNNLPVPNSVYLFGIGLVALLFVKKHHQSSQVLKTATF